MTPPSPREAPEARAALAAGIASYLIWGFLPLFLQAVGRTGAGSWEILAHRILWSVPVAALFVLWARQGRELLRVMRTPRTLALLALSALLIAVNWLLFIWAVNSAHTLETSLGYYITPLINMAAGAIIFREKISRPGFIAIGLAIVGVTLQAVALGHLPYVSLAIGLSFAVYGIVRKGVAASAQTGLLVECLLLSPPALIFILYLGGGALVSSIPNAAWIIASGPMTAAPLALFAWSARRLPLTAMGFLQFLAPTMSFVIGVSQGEPFTSLRALSFVFIWGGAAVFIWGAWRASRRLQSAE